MPTQMTPAQARVIDPISGPSRGEVQGGFVAHYLFPEVSVAARAGKVIRHNRDRFKQHKTDRAPGANVRRIQLAHTNDSFDLQDFALEVQVPFELIEEAGTAGEDLRAIAEATAGEIVGLWLERQAASLATTAGNYDSAHKLTSLSGSTLWSDLVNSNPCGAVAAGAEVIRASIGVRPNVIVVGPKVASALRQHHEVVDRFKHTREGIITDDMLARLFGVEQFIVGDAITDSDAGVSSDVWGNAAVLAYVDPRGTRALGSPSYGATYRLRGYPSVEEPYADRNAKSWIQPVSDACAPVIANQSAAYLISPAVA